MPTLTVAASTDYRSAPNNALVNGQNITAITFTNIATFADATFSNTQFGGTNIANNLILTGSAASNRIAVTLTAAATFSAALWTFVNWTGGGSDFIFLTGSSGADDITGSTGDDAIDGGNGADTLRGGAGNDEFRFDPGDIDAGESIIGGAGIDTFAIKVSDTIDFSAGTITEVERVRLGQGATAIFSGTQLGAASGLTLIEGSTNATPVALVVNGSNVDLSALSFTNWGNGGRLDTITINGVTGFNTSLVGSSEDDAITVGAGALVGLSTLRGGGGADTLTGGNFSGHTNAFAYRNPSEIRAGEALVGGSLSTDRIVIEQSGSYDFRLASLTSIEAVDFDAPNGSSLAVFNSDQFGAGLSTNLQFDGSAGSIPNILQILMTTQAFSAAGFTTVNFSTNREILTIVGTSGSDTITGATFGTELTGGAGSDFLRGGNADDTFVYNAASETGDASVQGNNGTDTIKINSNEAYDFTTTGLSSIEQYIFNTTGGASIALRGSQIGSTPIAILAAARPAMTFTVGSLTGVFSAAPWTLDSDFLAAGTIVLNATPTNTGESITGSTGRDSMSGFSGSDTLRGGSGADTLIGGLGADSIDGGIGDDRIILLQGEAHDSVDGGADFDTLDLTALTTDSATVNLTTGFWRTTADGTDRPIANIEAIRGGGGNDSLTAGTSPVGLFGGGGNDTLTGDGSALGFDGGDGDDTLRFLASATQAQGAVAGGLGSDTIELGTTSVSFLTTTSVSGVERLVFTNPLAFVEATFRGSDIGSAALGRISQISGTVGQNSLRLEGSSIDLSAVSVLNWFVSDFITLVGTNGNDTLIGSTQNDTLTGAAGADNLSGGGGDDMLDGGAGIDTLSGGDGVDTLSYASATSGAGILFYLLAPLLNGGDAAGDIYTQFENVTGTPVNDRIYMDNGDNSVQGGGGAFDTVELYAGNDRYLGGSGFDYVLAGAGTDNISVGSGGSLVYGEGDNDFIIADDGSNELYGGAGDDTIIGGIGQDVILGGAGQDSIVSDVGGDFLFGEDGDDTILGESGVDQIQGGLGRDVLRGGTGADVIQGGADADSINGDGDGDFVFGEAGNDTVLGGAGNDQVFGGADNDSLEGNAGVDILDGGDGDDTINDSGSGELTFSIGGNGNDTIIGTNGQDQMWGGTGSIDTGRDVFQFGAGNGLDIIFDFQGGPGIVDQIRLLGTGIASFAQLQAENRIGQAGANTQINLVGSGNVIFLMNTVATTLVADDFLFA